MFDYFTKLCIDDVTFNLYMNEEQIITGYPIDGAMGSSGGGRVRKLSVACLHNNTIVARGILVTILHFETLEPCINAIYILLVLLEPHYFCNIETKTKYMYVSYMSKWKIYR